MKESSRIKSKNLNFVIFVANYFINYGIILI